MKRSKSAVSAGNAKGKASKKQKVSETAKGVGASAATEKTKSKSVRSASPATQSQASSGRLGSKSFKPTSNPIGSGSALLRPAFQVGVVAETAAPMAISRLGTEDFVSVAWGDSFAVYGANDLKVKFVGPPARSA